MHEALAERSKKNIRNLRLFAFHYKLTFVFNPFNPSCMVFRYQVWTSWKKWKFTVIVILYAGVIHA